jgi:hypothetical protein
VAEKWRRVKGNNFMSIKGCLFLLSEKVPKELKRNVCERESERAG